MKKLHKLGMNGNGDCESSNKSTTGRRRSIDDGTGDQGRRHLIRVRRGHGYGVAGPVYTYVKTDYHGNFKWGARHNVGKGYGRRRRR